MTDFFSLEVTERRREVADAVTLTLAVPPTARERFRFVPGQYLTLRVVVDGEECCRAYSISGAPAPDRLMVTVKRLQHGRVSAFMCERIAPGMVIDTQPPCGEFTLPQTNGSRNVVAFAAGSGIAPLLTIAEQMLDAERSSRFLLIYGNRSRNSIMFRETVERLKDCYLGRFSVHHVFSREPQEFALWGGRIDAEKVARFCRAICPPAIVDTYLLCGPGNTSDVVRDELVGWGVAPERIRIERFTLGDIASPASVCAAPSQDVDDRNSEVVVVRDGATLRFIMPRGERGILDGARRAAIDLPYSCRAGVCGTCRAKLLQGKVEMNRCHALRPEEVSAGFVLACRARPMTESIVLDFDQAWHRQDMSLAVAADV